MLVNELQDFAASFSYEEKAYNFVKHKLVLAAKDGLYYCHINLYDIPIPFGQKDRITDYIVDKLKSQGLSVKVKFEKSNFLNQQDDKILKIIW